MLKLHLGCGRRRPPDFTHIDARDNVEADVVTDIRDLHMYESNSVDLIYACHVLEHIPRPELPSILGEWQILLKPNVGVLRLSVPDLAAICELYILHDVHLVRLQGLIWGRQNYSENTHYCGWDYETLAYLLSRCGFYDVKRWEPSEVFPKDYHDYSFARINELPVSLNVEAIAAI
jgi:ubiquinone/menaquinone biosynthesis C-methylase UbiE